MMKHLCKNKKKYIYVETWKYILLPHNLMHGLQTFPKNNFEFEIEIDSSEFWTVLKSQNQLEAYNWRQQLKNAFGVLKRIIFHCNLLLQYRCIYCIITSYGKLFITTSQNETYITWSIKNCLWGSSLTKIDLPTQYIATGVPDLHWTRSRLSSISVYLWVC